MPKFNDTKIFGDLTVTGTISGNTATTTESGLMSAEDKVRLDGLNQDDISDGATYKRVSQTEKNTWNGKQDKLTPGDNITIDSNNVISASGGGSEPQIITVNNLSDVDTGTKLRNLLSPFDYLDTLKDTFIITTGSTEWFIIVDTKNQIMYRYTEVNTGSAYIEICANYFNVILYSEVNIEWVPMASIPDAPDNDFYIRRNNYWYRLAYQSDYVININSGSEIRALMNSNEALMYMNVDTTNYKLLKVFGATDWGLGVFAQYVDLTTGEEYQMANVQVVVADTADPIWVKIGDKTTIKEQNKNTDIKFWTGSQTEYDSLSVKDENTLYFIEEE